MKESPLFSFEGKSICFTGCFDELTRAEATKEARGRKAYVVGSITDKLDYLVVGSIPSKGWKFGKYGRKIESAKNLNRFNHPNRKPLIIPESVFIDELGKYPKTKSGELTSKVFVGNFVSFVSPSLMNELCDNHLKGFIKKLEEEQGLKIKMKREYAFWEVSNDSDEIPYRLTLRFIKFIHIDDSGNKMALSIEEELEKVNELDGTLTWFERKEDVSDFIRLLKENE